MLRLSEFYNTVDYHVGSYGMKKNQQKICSDRSASEFGVVPNEKYSKF